MKKNGTWFIFLFITSLFLFRLFTTFDFLNCIFALWFICLLLTIDLVALKLQKILETRKLQFTLFNPYFHICLNCQRPSEMGFCLVTDSRLEHLFIPEIIVMTTPTKIWCQVHHYMVILVMEFSNGGYKIRKIFAKESTYPKEMIEFWVFD